MATSIQCPIPSTINPLTPNGFMLSIQKLPELSFFCQSAILPEISLGQVVQGTPFSDNQIPGDKIEFGELQVRFLVDDKMENYSGIFNWIKGLGFPESYDQYSDFISRQNNSMSDLANNYSDGTLGILNSNFQPVKSISFVDLYPTSLSSLEFTTTSTDIEYLTGVATFKYTYFTL